MTRLVLLTCTALLLIVGRLGLSTVDAAQQPNIVFIMADDMG